MKNSAGNTETTSLKTKATLRSDVHSDIGLHYLTSENELGDLLDDAVNSNSADERVAAAQKALQVSKEPCGMAHMILARESEVFDQALDYSQKAVASLQKEVEKLQSEESANADDHYEASGELYHFAVADLAQLKWNAGSQKEATDLLMAQFSPPLSQLDSAVQPLLVDLATSFLIQMGECKKAQEFLQGHPDNEAQWHYLNAVLHFALEGDTLVARSALAHGFASGSLLIANRLVEKEAAAVSVSLRAFGLSRYIEDTEAAWLAVTGSLAWLAKVTADPQNLSNRELLVIATANGDTKRWQRWEDLLENAHHFAEKQNHKEARTALKTALKEAERIDYSFLPFHATIAELLDLYIDTQRPANELIDSIEARAAKFENSSDALTALHIHSLASLLEFFQQFDRAAAYHQKALLIAERQLTGGQSFLTLFDLTDMRNDLAFVLFKMKNYDQALPHFLKNAEILQSFLGPAHWEILESLEQAYECYVGMDDQVNADAVMARMKGIDSDFELNDHDDDDCGSCDHDHH